MTVGQVSYRALRRLLPKAKATATKWTCVHTVGSPNCAGRLIS